VLLLLLLLLRLQQLLREELVLLLLKLAGEKQGRVLIIPWHRRRRRLQCGIVRSDANALAGPYLQLSTQDDSDDVRPRTTRGSQSRGGSAPVTGLHRHGALLRQCQK
jgi:hypothetical protein